MARVSSINNTKLNLMVYGKAKSRKTLFCGKLADAGYNVIFITGEPNMSILQSDAIKHPERIHVLSAYDSPRIGAARFVTAVTKCMKEKTSFNDATNALASGADLVADNAQVVDFEPSKLTLNDIVVIDNMSLLKESLTLDYVTGKNKELLQDLDDTRAYYGDSSNRLKHLVRLLIGLPCHVVMVGQEQLREAKVETNTLIKSTQTALIPECQPETTSVTQGVIIASFFNQVLHFNLADNGETKISAVGTSNVIAGGSFMKPAIHPFSTFPYGELLKAQEFVPTEAIKYHYEA